MRSNLRRVAFGSLMGAVIAASSGCQHDYVYWRQKDPNRIGEVESRLAALAEQPPPPGSEAARNVADFRKDWEVLTGDSSPEKLIWSFRNQGLRIRAAGAGTTIASIASATEKASSETLRRVRAHLNQAILDGVYGDEAAAIRAARADVQAGRGQAGAAPSHHPRIGLALSGGGIRSASFAVGVLQGLEEIGVLDDVGYLSTVSGGGWAGYWFMTQEASAKELLSPASRHLGRVAERGNFLSASNYSKAKMDVATKTLAHLFFLPLHWLANGLFDLDQDVLLARCLFRRGIHYTFAYRDEVGRIDDQTPRPMADYLPRAKRTGVKGPKTWCKPFWIVNMHLALSADNFHNNRSGDAFEVTPLRTGADSAGYVETPAKAEGSANWLRADHAVAISSAAVDSRSLQSGWLINTATDVANLDLGSYVDGWNPAWTGKARTFWNYVHFWLTSPFFVHEILGRIPGLGGVFGTTLHDEELRARRMLLTDGGHYENTGVYALVRRGCRLIILSDATRDPLVNDFDRPGSEAKRASAFEDIRRLNLLLRADFGCDVQFRWRDFRVGTPGGGYASTAETRVLVGKISNLPILDGRGAIDDEVTILVVKAAYANADRQIETNGFVDFEKAAQPDFPHDSTANLFYSERKVLSYRELARQIVLKSRSVFDAEVAKVRSRH